VATAVATLRVPHKRRLEVGLPRRRGGAELPFLE